jgi:hypothetical protein
MVDGPSSMPRFFSFPRQALGSTQPPIQWISGLKRARLEADHSLSSSVEVKNVSTIHPLPHIFYCIVIKHGNKFIFTQWIDMKLWTRDCSHIRDLLHYLRSYNVLTFDSSLLWKPKIFVVDSSWICISMHHTDYAVLTECLHCSYTTVPTEPLPFIGTLLRFYRNRKYIDYYYTRLHNNFL